MDYESGIEAMILAILQQTTYSQQIELAELTDVVLQTTQDDIVANGLLLTAYADYLAAALAENADVTSIIQTSLLNITTTSILPVSDDLLSAHVLADQRPFGFSLVICWPIHIAAEDSGMASLLHSQQRDYQLSICMSLWATFLFLITYLNA